MIENDNINVVEMLREKTEEQDLDSVLTSTFGGYTKKSVQDYLLLVKKQQQQSQETFSKNLQTLFEEKESLRRNNETLVARLNKLSAEYDNMSESLKNIKIDDSEYTEQDVIPLKNRILSLEEQIKVTERENYSLERKKERLNNDINELTLKLEQSIKEAQAQKEMLKAEKNESKKQRDTVADISRMLEEEKNEVKYLKGIMTEGNFAELNLKISELSVQLSYQTEILEKLNADIKFKDSAIDSLNDEVALLKQKLSSTTKLLQDTNTQNDKLLVSNEALKYQLQEEYKKSIELINEKSNFAIDRLIAEKNLNEAEAKLSSLEMQLLKIKKSDEVKDSFSRMKKGVDQEDTKTEKTDSN